MTYTQTDNPVYEKQEVYFESENLLYKPCFFLKRKSLFHLIIEVYFDHLFNFLHYDEIMDSLMKAAENFVEETSEPEENFDESLFVEFMRKVPIWDFYCISK